MDEQLSPALAAFGLISIAQARMSGGLESTVWRVETAEGVFAVRRHAAGTNIEALVASELAWLDALSAGEVVLAPRPMRRKDGTLAPVAEPDAAGEAVAAWSVLSWVNGAPLGRLPIAAEARATGAMVAAMHRRTREWMPPATFTRPAYDSPLFRAAGDTLFASAGEALGPREKATLEHALFWACGVLDRLWSERRDIGVIHSDLHDGNLMWLEGGDRPGVIDFGRCGLAPLALDVAMAQHYLTSDIAADLLDGYEAENIGATLDHAALPALRFLAAVENLATLSRFPAEGDSIRAELPWLIDQAREVAP